MRGVHRRRPRRREPRSIGMTALLSRTFTALCVASLMLAGGIQTATSVRMQQVIVATEQHRIAQEAAVQVSGFIQDRLNALAAMVWFADLPDATPGEREQALESLLGYERPLRGAIMLDAEGRVAALASRQSRQLAAQLANRLDADLLSSVRGGRTAVSVAFIDPSTSEPLVIVAVPVRDARREYRGVLAVEVNLKFMWDFMDRLSVGRTGVAYVVDRQGDLLAFHDPSRVLRQENVGNLLTVKEFMRDAAKGEAPGVRAYRGITGATVLGTYLALEVPDWAVVTEVPVREAYAAIIRNAFLSGGIILCMALFSALAGISLARRLSVPLVSLTDTASRIAAGELDLQAPSARPRELADLAVAFNSMTARLRGSLEGLERTVSERTWQLQDALALQTEVFEASPAGLLVYDAAGQCVMANEASARITGGTVEQLLRQNCTTVEAWKAAGLRDAMLQALSTGKDVGLEAHFTSTFGREVWSSCLFSPFSSVGGRYLLLTFQDISERTRAQMSITALNEELRERAEGLAVANTELEAFTYSVSHDLRAPLRAIGAYARILIDDHGQRMESEAKRLCGLITAQTGQMGRLIDGLLAFSRLGRRGMRPSRIDMTTLARSVFEDLASTEESAPRADFHLEELPPAVGDPVLIQQVWANLISNAVKFSSRTAAARIDVTGGCVGGENVYHVRDNGSGFDMRYAGKLFNVFQRLHSDEEYEGTGIGLAIVQKIVRRHGGRVWAEGRVGEGALFSFALPAQ